MLQHISSCVQAVQLLIMYGADASIQNCFKLTPPYLALSEECLKLFDLLDRDGELCRHDLRQRLADDRDEAAALKAERAAEQERRCAPAKGTTVATFQLPRSVASLLTPAMCALSVPKFSASCCHLRPERWNAT